MYICIWIGVDIEEEVMLSTHYASHDPCLHSLSGSVGIPTVNPEYIVHSQVYDTSSRHGHVLIPCCSLYLLLLSLLLLLLRLSTLDLTWFFSTTPLLTTEQNTRHACNASSRRVQESQYC